MYLYIDSGILLFLSFLLVSLSLALAWSKIITAPEQKGKARKQTEGKRYVNNEKRTRLGEKHFVQVHDCQ